MEYTLDEETLKSGNIVSCEFSAVKIGTVIIPEQHRYIYRKYAQLRDDGSLFLYGDADRVRLDQDGHPEIAYHVVSEDERVGNDGIYIPTEENSRVLTRRTTIEQFEKIQEL